MHYMCCAVQMFKAARTASCRLSGLQLFKRGSRPWRLSSTPEWESSNKSVFRKQWVALTSPLKHTWLRVPHSHSICLKCLDDNCSVLIWSLIVFLLKKLKHITDYSMFVMFCEFEPLSLDATCWESVMFLSDIKWAAYSYLLDCSGELVSMS